jgi:hypothetical protein
MTSTFGRGALALLAAGLALLPAQGRTDPRSAESRREPSAQGPASELIAATREYRTSLEKLLPFREADVTRTTEAAAKRRELLDRGIVSRREVEEAEQARESAEDNLRGIRAQIAQAETLIAEAMASEQLRRLAPAPSPKEGGTGAERFTYYSGTTAWSLADTSKIERFFAGRFGRPLPVSAFGQTAVHDQLGFDHRGSLDVAVHPDSVEGRALMAYLRGAAIPFIAFRSAVPGAATGAHIHIGPASHRMAHAASERG